MHRLIPLLFLLTACATSAPSSYHQSAPAYRPVPRPPAWTPGYAPGTPADPVYTPAGAGLPGERVPGAGAPAVPRSPNKRAVPPEPDGAPGLWAADAVEAANKGDRSPAQVLGVELPSARGKSSAATRVCAYHMTQSFEAAGVARHARALSESERRCLTARLLQHCLHTVGYIEIRRLESMDADTSDWFEDIEAARAVAQRVAEAACTGMAVTEQVKDVQARSVNLMVRSLRGDK